MRFTPVCTVDVPLGALKKHDPPPLPPGPLVKMTVPTRLTVAELIPTNSIDGPPPPPPPHPPLPPLPPLPPSPPSPCRFDEVVAPADEQLARPDGADHRHRSGAGEVGRAAQTCGESGHRSSRPRVGGHQQCVSRPQQVGGRMRHRDTVTGRGPRQPDARPAIME